MRTTTFTPESPNDPAHTTILQASNEDKNASQLGVLLSVQAEARQILWSRTEAGETVELDREAREAASSTYVAAAHQIRNLIDDQERWTLRQNAVDAKTEAVLDLKIREQTSRVALNDRLSRPSFVMRPKVRLVALADGRAAWCCWLGGDNPGQADVHAIGSSPDAACRAFDEAFNKDIQQQEPAEGPPEPKSKVKRSPKTPKKK